MTRIYLSYLSWLLPLAIATLQLSIFPLTQKWRTRRWAEKNQGYCFVPGCTEFNTEDLYVNITFKERDALKEKWRVCKDCARALNDADLKTEWLSRFHFYPGGWQQHAPSDGTPLESLSAITPKGVAPYLPSIRYRRPWRPKPGEQP
jgi:hypothetical protein